MQNSKHYNGYVEINCIFSQTIVNFHKYKEEKYEKVYFEFICTDTYPDTYAWMRIG